MKWLRRSMLATIGRACRTIIAPTTWASLFSSHVSDLERHNTFFGPIWPVIHTGGAAGVHSLLEKSISLPLTSLNDKHLLPEVVHKRFRTSATGVYFDHPGHKHLLGILSEDFLVMTRRCACNRYPGQIVSWKKFKLRLRHGLAS